MSPKLKWQLKQVCTLSPHITCLQIFYMIKRRLFLYRSEKSAKTTSTYSHYQANLHRLVSRPNHATISTHLLDHHFDLLGSGWTHVKYGMEAQGVEGNTYTSQPALQLKERLNSPNLHYAEKVSKLIDPHYDPIDWQIDFKSGYRWSEKTPSHKIDYGTLPGVDIKVPWELARMQHLPQLAFAYHLQKEEKYVREFQNQILDFIANNPPRFGVNWCCTMDVGIRIANWLVAFDLFKEYGAVFDTQFETIFVSSVYDHGKHIKNHLEWMPSFRGNHYLANIVGLLFVSAYLPETPQIEKWFKFSVKELIKEVSFQFHKDGTSFEGSTSYHCLSAQMVAYATALTLTKKGNSPFPNWYFKRLKKMAQFVKDITKPNNAIVQIGDHDSGYLFRLFPPYDNHLNKNTLIEELHLNTLYPHPLPKASDVTAKNRIAPGKLSKLTKKLSHCSQTTLSFPYTPGNITCYSYPHFGLYLYKSPHLFLSVRVGSIGQKRRGGHAHNDQLAVELVIDGEEIAVDPGTYLYTPLPNQRNAYRSVQAHFAPQVEGKEPSNLKADLFRLEGDPKGKCLHFDSHSFLGVHTGYGFPVYRLIELKDKIYITDFSEKESLVPLKTVLKRVQNIPFSPGYGKLIPH